MKVQEPRQGKNNSLKKKVSKEEVLAKIKEKFGKDLGKKPVEKSEIKDKLELSSRGKGVKNSQEEGFGDAGRDKPDNKFTQDKLKNILKTGSFQFSERERATLSKILK